MSPAAPERRRLGAEKPPGAESVSQLHGLLDQLLDEGLAVELRVTGTSMSPFIRSGDLLTLVPRKGRPIRRGDVVAFLADRRWLVVHRVIAVDGRNFLSRGDAVRRDDGWVEVDDVIALVTRVERRRRRVRLGLGRERRAVAWLSGRGWLVAMLRPARWLARRLMRRP